MYGTRSIHRIATEHQADERRHAATARFAAAAAAAARVEVDAARTAGRRSWLRWPARRRGVTTAVRGASA